jgi:PAS domain S-box-containing protein
MSPSQREERLRFLDLTERDAALLRELKSFFETHVARIEDAFYEQLLSYPETAQLLRDRTNVERLKKLQRDYLLRIAEGQFDDAYFEDRLRIGRTHERVGLSPRWYLAAFSLYFKLFAPLLFEHYAAEPARAQAALLALEKVFMLDASLAMDAYITSDRYRHLRQLESIVNDSADVIFMLDNQKRIRAWNRAAERILGWPADEIIGQTVNVIVPPDMQEGGELERIDQLLEQQGYCHFETERLARDGRRVPVELTLSLLHDPHGEAIGRSVILRDITERLRLEEAKVQSERLATIGTMSARLAHEIRNPLSSITLNLDLVGDEMTTLTRLDPAAAKEAQALLKSIGSEVRRIQRVTEDYLKFARLPKLQRQRVDVNEVLRQGLAFLQSLFEATNVTLATKLAARLPPIEADDSQLWQAVLNLVRNAVEAMPAGGTLTLETRVDHTWLEVRVADTGGGMTPAQHQQLFKPFFSTKTGGTGLGLPLTQQIIAEHGGSIVCETAAGEGATFIIRLPVQEEKENGPTR